jgi:SAM-dependent methyltransferase
MEAEPFSRGADTDYEHSPQALATETTGLRHLATEFLPRLFTSIGIGPGARVLDVGCGMGEIVTMLRDQGYDAYGLEPGGRFEHLDPALRGKFIFHEYSNEFQAEPFDFCMSNGVIEHVGTLTGHDDLGPNYLEERRAFVQSLIRLTKPGGYVFIACPNRLFPLDFQHGPHGYGPLPKLKHLQPPLSRLTLPWHSRNYLASFADIEAFCTGQGITAMRIPQGNYLALTQLAHHPAWKRAFNGYIDAVDKLPSRVWDFLHTHTLFLGRKEAP